MHTILPARLNPGMTLDDLPAAAADGAQSGAPTIVRGRALIFWDPKLPGTRFGHKLDAIDTDQITPAADCVSESLERLDERWKAGAFRYLMPDFRARVHRRRDLPHRGRSLRDRILPRDEPRGTQGIAEEAGLELVIVCGHNMGDIFRQNALNLGLHVVQSPEAVADARDGDVFEFEPASRRLPTSRKATSTCRCRSRPRKTRSARAAASSRGAPRVLRHPSRTPPSIEWPGRRSWRGDDRTEQIVWAHRVDKTCRGRARRDASRLC